jgi:hypothetical protein
MNRSLKIKIFSTAMHKGVHQTAGGVISRNRKEITDEQPLQATAS